jgi:hypothetical protein
MERNQAQVAGLARMLIGLLSPLRPRQWQQSSIGSILSWAVLVLRRGFASRDCVERLLLVVFSVLFVSAGATAQQEPCFRFSGSQ